MSYLAIEYMVIESLKLPLLQVCCHESMQAAQHRLKHLGIHKLTQPVGLASAMDQLPDKAIELAAAAHIERELQISSWNLTSNFVACMNQVPICPFNDSLWN